MAAFLDEDAFASNEPQKFGMVSFTQLSIEQAEAHRQQFGAFGIAVSWQWALRNGVERVLYVGANGYLFETWKFLFQSALKDLRARASDRQDGCWDMSIHNRAMAAVMGATAWATLLRLYEFMQPDTHAPQVEWRVVQSQPFHFSSSKKEEQIAQALALADTWKVANLVVVPDDVSFLVCPEGCIDELRGQLPAAFQDVRIVTYRDAREA
jgi:hypothetical protein